MIFFKNSLSQTLHQIYNVNVSQVIRTTKLFSNLIPQKLTTQKSLFQHCRFLGHKVFTNQLGIPNLPQNVPVLDFAACLTFLFHFHHFTILSCIHKKEKKKKKKKKDNKNTKNPTTSFSEQNMLGFQCYSESTIPSS